RFFFTSTALSQIYTLSLHDALPIYAKGDFFVQMGILRSQVNIKDVEKIEEQTITGPGTSMQKSSTSKIKMNKSSYVSPEVNLIRSEEHTSELQSRFDLVCRLLLEKK